MIFLFVFCLSLAITLTIFIALCVNRILICCILLFIKNQRHFIIQLVELLMLNFCGCFVCFLFCYFQIVETKLLVYQITLICIHYCLINYLKTKALLSKIIQSITIFWCKKESAFSLLAFSFLGVKIIVRSFRRIDFSMSIWF